jgi:hypothetical protein
MLSRNVRLIFLAGSVLVACSCSKQNNSQPAPSDEATSPPNVTPSAAPGIAFNYAYDFNLPDDHISATQEAHASACEKLGLARCRITGMSYTVNQNEEVAAELDLKLDPAIARAFGKSALQVVEANDGKLFRLQIGSSDEGAAIDLASRQKNDTAEQLAQLQQELAKTKPGTSARANLTSQIQTLQQRSSGQASAIATSQAVLASTPMAFHYYGRGGVPGFRGNPVREAWQTFVTTVVWMVGILLQAFAVLIPLALLVAALITLWRTRPIRIIRAWIKGPEKSDG